MHALSKLLNPRAHARHARPSKAAPALLAGGLTVGLAVADATLVAAPASAGGSVAQFERLASCESGGNWDINTGNGYYGGLQFALSTWRAYGGTGRPDQQSKAAQIAVAERVRKASGLSAWSCA